MKEYLKSPSGGIAFLLMLLLIFGGVLYAGEYQDIKVKLFAELKKKPGKTGTSRYKKWHDKVDALCLKLSGDPLLTEQNLEILVAVSPAPRYLKRSRDEVLPVLFRLAGTVMDRSIAAGKTVYSMKTSSMNMLNQLRDLQAVPIDTVLENNAGPDSSYTFSEKEKEEHLTICLDEIVNSNKTIRGIALTGLSFYRDNKKAIAALEIVRDTDPEEEFQTRAKDLLPPKAPDKAEDVPSDEENIPQ